MLCTMRARVPLVVRRSDRQSKKVTMMPIRSFTGRRIPRFRVDCSFSLVGRCFAGVLFHPVAVKAARAGPALSVARVVHETNQSSIVIMLSDYFCLDVCFAVDTTIGNN